MKSPRERTVNYNLIRVGDSVLQVLHRATTNCRCPHPVSEPPWVHSLSTFATVRLSPQVYRLARSRKPSWSTPLRFSGFVEWPAVGPAASLAVFPWPWLFRLFVLSRVP